MRRIRITTSKPKPKPGLRALPSQTRNRARLFTQRADPHRAPESARRLVWAKRHETQSDGRSTSDHK